MQLYSDLHTAERQVLSREQLYSFVWNEESNYNVDELIKAHIKAIRKKLTPSRKEYIKNVWGIDLTQIANSRSDSCCGYLLHFGIFSKLNLQISTAVHNLKDSYNPVIAVREI